MREYIIRETGYPGTLKKEIVQELVRCRDCEYWRDGNSIISDEPYCELDGTRCPEDHFCGAGERKKK